MAKTKTETLELLAQNQVHELCDALREDLQNVSSLNALALLEGQWNALADYARTGSITFEQVALEEAKIRARLADFIEKLDRQSHFGGSKTASEKGFSKSYLIAFVAAFAVAFAAFLLFQNRGEKAETPEILPKSSEKPVVLTENAENTLDGQRILPIKQQAFSLKSAYVGEVRFRLAQAIFRPANSQQNELEIRLNVQLESDKNHAFQPGAFSLQNGEETVGSQKIEPNLLEIGASKMVKITFLIPSNWPKTTLIVRHGVVKPAAEERIEIDLKN